MAYLRNARKIATVPLLSAAMLVGAVVSGVPLGAAHAQMPATQTQNDVQYLVGGIGLDESEAIKAAMKDYSLALIFAQPQEGGAAYLSDVLVRIEDAAGKSVLDVKPDGPYLLVMLPPGSYKVTASSGGNSQDKTLNVQAGKTTRQRLDWK